MWSVKILPNPRSSSLGRGRGFVVRWTEMAVDMALDVAAPARARQRPETPPGSAFFAARAHPVTRRPVTGRALDEQARERVRLVDAADRLGEQPGDGERADLRAGRGGGPERDRVRDDDLLDRALRDPLDGRAGEDRVRRVRVDLGRALVHQRVRRLRQGAGRVDHVVEEHRDLALHLADDVHDLGDVRLRAPLVDDAERGAEPLRIGARALDAARVGRDDDDVLRVAVEALAHVLEQHRGRIEVVERDREEALDLAGVHVHRDDASHPRRLDEVRDELRRDGDARGALPVLPGVAVVRDDRGDGPGRRALQRVRHDEELHQVRVRVRACGLDDEAVEPADVLADLHLDLAVGEASDVRWGQGPAELLADRLGERAVRVPCEHPVVVPASVRHHSRAPRSRPCKHTTGAVLPARNRHERAYTETVRRSSTGASGPGRETDGQSWAAAPATRREPFASSRSYSSRIAFSIRSRVSELSGWAMSLNEPSLRRFAGIAMNRPVFPWMTLRSRITKQSSSVIVT